MTRMTKPAHLIFLAALLAPATGMAEPTGKEAGPTQVTAGGYFTQSLNLVDIDDHSGLSLEDEVLTQNAEIHFKAEKALGNGIALAAHIQLEGAIENDQIDEHYLSVTAPWGKLLLGAENGVGHLLQVRAPSFVPGLKMYDNSLTDEGLEAAYDALLGEDEDEAQVLNDAHMSTKLEHISGDADKISFITPKVAGAQFAVSFTPNNSDRNGSTDNQFAHALTDLVQEDIIELAFSYSGRTGGVKYKFGYSAVSSDTLGSAIDPESNSTGLRVAWGDYVFGANASVYENLDQLPGNAYAGAKIDTHNIGLRKRHGLSQYGIGYTQSEESARGGGNLTEYEEWMIGGGRKLADGVQLGFYYALSEVDRPQADDDNAGAEIQIIGLTLDLRF